MVGRLLPRWATSLEPCELLGRYQENCGWEFLTPRATSEGFSFSASSAGAGTFAPDASIRSIDFYRISVELLSTCSRMGGQLAS